MLIPVRASVPGDFAAAVVAGTLVTGVVDGLVDAVGGDVEGDVVAGAVVGGAVLGGAVFGDVEDGAVVPGPPVVATGAVEAVEAVGALAGGTEVAGEYVMDDELDGLVAFFTKLGRMATMTPTIRIAPASASNARTAARDKPIRRA